MAARQQVRHARVERAKATSKAPNIYPPDAAPPRKRVPHLAIAASLLAAWLLFLLYLALRT